jgi:hypothetical protein
MGARRWDEVRDRRELLCQLAAKLTDSPQEAGSPAAAADRLLALRDRHFAGLAALVSDADQRGDLERWLRKSNRDAIRKALSRAMASGPANARREPDPPPAKEYFEQPAKPSPSRVPLAPLWLVGRKQRNDLLPMEAFPPAEYMGTPVPEILNRGKLPAREIQARIGTRLRLKAADALPGERVTFERFEGGSLYIYVLDLFGRETTFQDPQDAPGPVPELHLEFEMIYSYGTGRPRRLSGSLIGDRRRWFYRFEPSGGTPTPLYG